MSHFCPGHSSGRIMSRTKRCLQALSDSRFKFVICSPRIIGLCATGKPVKPIFLRGDDARRGAKELPDESEVLYVRKELDGEILSAKVIPEHAEHGRAYCKAVE